MRAARSPLSVNLKPSQTLLLCQLLVAVAAMVHLCLLPIATWPRLLAMALVIALALRLLTTVAAAAVVAAAALVIAAALPAALSGAWWQ